MMQLILRLYDGAKHHRPGHPPPQLKATGIFDTLTKMKYEIANDQLEKFNDYERMVDEALDKGGAGQPASARFVPLVNGVRQTCKAAELRLRS